MTRRLGAAAIIVGSVTMFAAYGQQMPAECEQAMKTLGKQGDFKDNVLQINIPRNDLKVTIDGIATPTPFGFGGWLAQARAQSAESEVGGSGAGQTHSERTGQARGRPGSRKTAQNGARDLLIGKMSEQVTATGTLVTKGCTKMLFIKSVTVAKSE